MSQESPGSTPTWLLTDDRPPASTTLFGAEDDMYSRVQRPLNEKERRALRHAITLARKRIRAECKRGAIASPIIFGALWVLTLLAAHDLSFVLVSLFWIVTGVSISVWVGVEAFQKHRNRIAAIEDALANGKADEVRISTHAMVELQEIEDEGACYAFQVEEGKIVFVCGQDYYPTSKFPSTDFSIIHILSRDGELVELLVVEHGEKLRPLRIVSSEAKKQLQVPEDLELICGRLDDLEEILKGSSPN